MKPKIGETGDWPREVFPFHSQTSPAPADRACARHSREGMAIGRSGSGRGGFALVVTCTLMVMLTVLAISLLSLATVSLRATGNEQDRAQARANARMGLMMALGDLQKEMGPDQRISGAAGVLDSNADTPDVEKIVHPQWLGVWNSWTGWLNATGIETTYTPGRASQFRSWLISNPVPAATKDREEASRLTGNLVSLVGSGTLGKNASAALQVRAPLVATRAGGFAWWVGGENQKARVAATPAPASDAGELGNRSAWPRSGTGGLDGLASLVTSSEIVSKAVSLPTLGVSNTDSAVRERLQGHFHDLTTDSVGLLANVRHGGMRKDLNLLLERKSLPEEFGTFGVSRQNGTIVPIRDEKQSIPTAYYGAKNPNFPSWYKLGQYYSLYKGEGDETSQDCIPLPFQRGLWGSGGPHANFNWDRGNFDQLGWARTPILSRMMMVFSTRRVPSRTPGKYDYKLGVNPVVVIWNPYNVTLHSGRLFIEIGPGSLESKTYVNGVQSSDWRKIKLSQRSDDKGNFKVRVYPMEGPGPANYSTPVILKPGETRIYSAKSGFVQADNQYHVELYPGYQPPEANGGFDIPLDGMSNLDGASRVELAMRVSDARNENDGVHQLYYVARNQETGDQQRYSEMAGSPIEDGRPMPIVEDSPGKRVVFSNSSQRVAFASFQFVLKSGEDLRKSGGQGGEDYRCRNFIHANPVNQRASFGEATDRMKGMAQYQVHVEQGAGNALNPDFDPATNRAYLGSAISLGNSTWPGQPAAVVTELPVVPITSLASLTHFKLNPGRTSFASEQHLWNVTANQALGIGNSFAHPLIAGRSIYQDVPDMAARGGGEWLEFKLGRDCYDQAFLNNDALWDDWFCSTITQQSRGIFGERRDLGDVVDGFLAGEKALPNPHLQPWRGSLDHDGLRKTFVEGSEPAEKAWRDASSHLVVSGAFNVNSTSVDAWKTLFFGLQDESVLYLDEGGSVRKSPVPKNRVVFSRFSLPCSAAEGANAGDPAAWLGIRMLTPDQIDRLAKECVKQVKLRGPFLNLSDFINRRLVDGEQGVCGALQAAIDWDEFGGKSPDAASINGRFKMGDDMIGAATVSNWGLPFPQAATGSRYAGIPGYLTQSDVLKRIGNMLTTRDDTFRVRTYGEARDKNGKVTSRAWCEAVIQRLPEYIDATDLPAIAAADLRSSVNRRFGRQLKVVSFRWLAPGEI